MMHHLSLNRNMVAFVDDNESERLLKFKWTIGQGGGGTYYVHTNDTRLPKHQRKLANFILKTNPGERVDHKNGDVLDYRKQNLRLCTHQQNTQNSIVPRISTKTSKFKGVVKSSINSWRSTICGLKIGVFNCELEAARAYDRAALERFGEFAKTNEMMGLFDGKDPHEERIKVLKTHKVESDTRFLKREPSKDRYTKDGKLEKAYRCQDGMLLRFTDFQPNCPPQRASGSHSQPKHNPRMRPALIQRSQHEQELP